MRSWPGSGYVGLRNPPTTRFPLKQPGYPARAILATPLVCRPGLCYTGGLTTQETVRCDD